MVCNSRPGDITVIFGVIPADAEMLAFGQIVRGVTFCACTKTGEINGMISPSGRSAQAMLIERRQLRLFCWI